MQGVKKTTPRIRAFVSYTHGDVHLAKEVGAILARQQVTADWDRNIQPGTAFTDSIKSRILHSHIFVPLITAKSQHRPWIHQETGYAMALNIPVLPLVFGEVKSFTPAMIAQLKAVVVAKASDLSRLPIGGIARQLVQPVASVPSGLVEIAYWPEVRTELLGRYAARVLDLAKESQCAPTIRQLGSLSSFCIPDADEDAAVWRDRDAPVVRSEYYHYLQRKERQALEQCARKGGCKLIVDLAVHWDGLKGISLTAQAVRLRTLREFFESTHDVKVVVSDRARAGNLTIVGDWFFAESIVPRAGKGFFQTIINWRHFVSALTANTCSSFMGHSGSFTRAPAELTRTARKSGSIAGSSRRKRISRFGGSVREI